MSKFGNAAIEASKTEFRQLLEKEVFVPKKWEELSSSERHDAIRSFMFFKEKLDGDGQVIKVKARFVANGKQQDDELYEDVSSPTASVTTLFTVLSLAAREKKFTAIGDITGAYLNASMPDENTVIVIIDNNMANIVCELDPKFERFRMKNGCLPVKLKKALYGCKQSAMLWYIT